jgi:precorrin-3B methylase
MYPYVCAFIWFSVLHKTQKDKGCPGQDLVQTRYRQDTDNIHVSVPEIQTSYRLDTNTILFIGESNTYTLKQLRAHSDVSVCHTDMYVSNTDISVDSV